MRLPGYSARDRCERSLAGAQWAVFDILNSRGSSPLRTNRFADSVEVFRRKLRASAGFFQHTNRRLVFGTVPGRVSFVSHRAELPRWLDLRGRAIRSLEMEWTAADSP